MMTTNGHTNGATPPDVLALDVRQAWPAVAWPQQDDPGWQRTRRVAAAVTSHRGWLSAVPVVLVNVVAFGAQLGFWHAHVPLPLEAVLVALALESIAIYLAWQSHLAQLADDSALRIRLAAYGMALLIGALNYSHFMLPGWRPTVAAVTFGMMSAISPWLWSVHSRRVSRDALKERGLIEAHAVRLGATRWLWHPVRSAWVMWHATWLGETDPSRAIALSAPAVRLEDKTPDSEADNMPDKTAARRPSRKVTTRTALDKAADMIRRHPDWTDTAVAKSAGVSTKTVQRARNGKTGSTT